MLYWAQEKVIILLLFGVEPYKLWEWNREPVETGGISRPALTESFLHVCMDVTAAQAGKCVAFCIIVI